MSRVHASAVPLYLQGWAQPTPVRKFAHLATAPKIPLHQLGMGFMGDPAAMIAVGASSGAKVLPVLSTAAWAGPVGLGIALVGSIIAGLWAAHERRAAGAKDENAAVNSAVTAFDGGMHAIFDAANSSDPVKNISAAQASQLCQAQLQAFWQSMAPHMKGPGRADTSNYGANCGNGTLNPGGPCTGTPGGHKCDKSCTAACCVGCQNLYPTILQALAVFNSPTGGTITACQVYGSKYGAVTRGSYTLTYTPPTIKSSVSGAVSSLESIFGGGAGASGSSSLLPIALAIAAFMVLR